MPTTVLNPTGTSRRAHLDLIWVVLDLLEMYIADSDHEGAEVSVDDFATFVKLTEIRSRS